MNLLFSGNIGTTIYTLLIRAFIIIAILPIHEFAHAYMAHRLGDDTAKYSGRLTLNPVRHLDPIGSIALLLAGIGWAKPVPVNSMNFKNRKGGMALTALAGPMSNFIVAFIAMFLYRIFFCFAVGMAADVFEIISFFFTTVISINIFLAIFNLIPCPPLDGSRIVGYFLSNKANYTLNKYENYIWIGLMVVIVTGVLDAPLHFIYYYVSTAFAWIINLPFQLISPETAAYFRIS